MFALKVGACVAIAVAVLWVGTRILGMLARPAPAPPPPGELRRVDARYRCAVCGMEMRITRAAEEDPEPPRHCMEEMQPVALSEG